MLFHLWCTFSLFKMYLFIIVHICTWCVFVGGYTCHGALVENRGQFCRICFLSTFAQVLEIELRSQGLYGDGHKKKSAISLAQLLPIQLYINDEKYTILHDVKSVDFSFVTSYHNIYYVESHLLFSNWVMPTTGIL